MGALKPEGRHDQLLFPKLLLVLLQCLIISGSGATAEDVSNRLLLDAEKQFRAVHIDSAVALAREALALKHKEVGASDTATASILLLISKYQFAAERFLASESSARQAVRVLQSIRGCGHPEVLRAQITLARSERNGERAVQADSLLRGIVSLVSIYGHDSVIEADACAELGIGYRFRNQFDSARVCFDRAMSIYDAQAGDFRAQRRQIEISRGRILIWESRYADAEILFEHLIRDQTATCARDSLTLAELRYHRGQAHRMLGKYVEAEDDERVALAIRRRILGTYHYLNAEADYVLGMVYQDRGDYYNATRFLEESLRVFRLTIGVSDWRVGGVLRNLARLHDEVGAFAEAESLYLAAVANRERALGPQHPGVAQVVMEVATFYVKHGKHDQAEKLLQRTLAILEKAFKPDHETFAVSLDGLGRICLAQRRFGEALVYFKRAREICQKVFGSESPSYALCQQHIASVYAGQQHFGQAKSLFSEAAGIMHSALGEDHPLASECLELKSACEFLVGDFETALSDAQQAFYSRKRNFRANCDILSEADALRFADLTRWSADRSLSCYLEAVQHDFACANQANDIILSAKGIVSDEVFDRRRALALTSDPAILSTFAAYKQVRRKLSESFVQDVRTFEPPSSSQSIVYLGKVSDSLEADLALRNASFRNLREPDTPTAERLSALIPEGARLVEYMKFNRVDFGSNKSVAGYVAAVLGRNSPTALVDLGSAATIDSLVRLYQEHFRSASKDWPNLSDREVEETDQVLRGLFQKVFRPLQNSVKDGDLLLIAPDGALNLVSFGTLKDEEGRYVIESKRIHYLNAARELLRLRVRSPVGEGLLALGDPDFGASDTQRPRSLHSSMCGDLLTAHSPIDNSLRSLLDAPARPSFSPLPYTRREVLKVADFWHLLGGDSAEVLLGVDASEERFKRQAPGKGVIHVATHAFFQPGHYSRASSEDPESATLSRNPLLFSGLVLAGANTPKTSRGGSEEDGFLTADEVSSLRLDGTRLVVLSACETGLGEIESGEGVYGLRRAFHIAGARTIVSSLWQVPDRETETMMETLYSTKRGTLDAAMQRMALRQIERNRKLGLPDHPYLWGAFVAFGDWRVAE
jgi:CHAT domain-containing protein